MECIHDEEIAFRGIVISGPSIWFIWAGRPMVSNYGCETLSSEDMFIRHCDSDVIRGTKREISFDLVKFSSSTVKIAVGEIPIQMNDAICLAVQACESMSRLDRLHRTANPGLTEDRVCGVCLEGSYDRAMARKLDLRFCREESVDIPLNRGGLFVRAIPASNKIMLCREREKPPALKRILYRKKGGLDEIIKLTLAQGSHTDFFLRDMESNDPVACRFGGMVQGLIGVGRDHHGGTVSSYQAIRLLSTFDSKTIMMKNNLSMKYSVYINGRIATGKVPKSALWLADANGTLTKIFTFEQ